MPMPFTAMPGPVAHGALRELVGAFGSDPGWRRLTAAEEIDLGRRHAAGDKAAGDRLATANLRLVIHVASRFRRAGRDIEDRVADGTLGLLRAVEKWDPERGFRFGTYATWWIKQAICRGSENGGIVRVPVYARALARKWSEILDRLRDEFGREPTDDEVAGAAGLSGRRRAMTAQARRMLAPRPAGDAVAADDDARDPVIHLLETIDAGGPSPEDEAAAAEFAGAVRGRLSILPPREAEVIRRRFGLDGPEETLLDIGRSLGITRERVRQLETRAMGRLRKHAAESSPRPPMVPLSSPMGGLN